MPSSLLLFAVPFAQRSPPPSPLLPLSPTFHQCPAWPSSAARLPARQLRSSPLPASSLNGPASSPPSRSLQRDSQCSFRQSAERNRAPTPTSPSSPAGLCPRLPLPTLTPVR